jgi:transcriptional regulator with XRE-family HTH domain
MEGNFNRHLGSKLRMRRLALGLTQTKVANAINVTFQQIQKYEKGTNGISSLRLMQLANFLKIPVIYFFEDYPGYLSSSSESGNVESVDLNYSFLARLFSNLSTQQKDKIFQVLRNTKSLEKTG